MAGAAVFGRLKWHVGTSRGASRLKTATARTITFELPEWPGHVAGQRVDLRVTAADGYSVVRSDFLSPRHRGAEERIELWGGTTSRRRNLTLPYGGPLRSAIVWSCRDRLAVGSCGTRTRPQPIQLVAGGIRHRAADGDDPVAFNSREQRRTVSLDVLGAQPRAASVPR